MLAKFDSNLLFPEFINSIGYELTSDVLSRDIALPLEC